MSGWKKGSSKATPALAEKENGEEPPPSTIGKMRRRLTVGGTSANIDGVTRMNDLEAQLGGESVMIPKNAVTEIAGSTKKGYAPYNPRKKNQDALIMKSHVDTNTIVICVLDGHGEHGDSVSSYFASHLASRMFNHDKWETDIRVAVREAILSCEEDVLNMHRVDTDFSGTTLSMAIVREDKLFGVNIGDSRVIVGKNASSNGVLNVIAEEFTHDHKPDTPAERERIIQAGGRVFAVQYDDGIDGPPRVWLGNMDVPGLAMSRSLGDTVAHTAGVTSEPDFTERTLDPESDKFLVVATDGLWEFMTNEECVAMMVEDAGKNSQSAVDILIQEANARWMREEQVIDDTTVVVAHLFGYGKDEEHS